MKQKQGMCKQKQGMPTRETDGLRQERQTLVIIGAGPAGLAAAIAAYDAGIRELVVLERDEMAGGILNQCIHNGFGLHTFHEELTGPEYADRYITEAKRRNIPIYLNTMVISLSADKVLTVVNREHGLWQILAGAVILAMGCRERARGALRLPGTRPAGIYTAGTAQRYVNMEGRMPGKRVVILGSGDIGLIMARRMSLEGAEVLAVAELLPYSGGLQRNIVQCLEDFSIPLKLSHTVVDIRGQERVEAVTLAAVDDRLRPIPGTEEIYDCDTLLLSCGLLPENELSLQAGLALHPVTGGPVVDESLQTEIPGIFACGNVLHVHDLVDFVSGEAALAGERAAAWLQGKLPDKGKLYRLRAGNGVRYTVPTVINSGRMPEKQTIRFRVGAVYRSCEVVVEVNNDCLLRRRKQVLLPAEMEQLILSRELLESVDSAEVTIRIEEVEGCPKN